VSFCQEAEAQLRVFSRRAEAAEFEAAAAAAELGALSGKTEVQFACANRLSFSTGAARFFIILRSSSKRWVERALKSHVFEHVSL
jgi:hypothetical protein